MTYLKIQRLTTNKGNSASGILLKRCNIRMQELTEIQFMGQPKRFQCVGEKVTVNEDDFAI
jgi:hypothetical protein